MFYWLSYVFPYIGTDKTSPTMTLRLRILILTKVSWEIKFILSFEQIKGLLSWDQCQCSKCKPSCPVKLCPYCSCEFSIDLPVSVAEIVRKIVLIYSQQCDAGEYGRTEEKKNTSLFLSLLHQYLIMER